jgi:putative ABC transport system permease protein
MWKLALRNVLRHKARSAFTLLAISAGVVGLILSGGFVQDIFVQLGEMLIRSQSGHVQVSRAGYHEQGARSPEKYLLEDTEALRQAIASLPQVDDVMGRVFFTGLLNNGRSDLPIIGEGVEPDRERRLGSSLRITAGRQLEAGDSGGVLIGHGLAQALQLEPGDRVILLLNTAGGAVNSLDLDVVGVFQSFSKDYDARAVRLPLATAQDLLATAGVNTLVVSLRHTRDTEAVQRLLEARLAGQGLEVKTWQELNDFYAKTVTLYEVQFGALRLIILLMVLLSVANSVNTSVFERVAEFGTMMALGNRSRMVFRLILAENFLLGLAGAGLGLVLGVVLALAISAVGIPMPPPPNSDLPYTGQIRLVPSVLIGAFAVGFLATVGAALMPALRVSRIPVVDALRQAV